MITMSFVPCSRRGLLACVYNGVSLTTDPLVAGNGSYIVRPCGHDLHGPTVGIQLQHFHNDLIVSKLQI